MLLNTNLIKKIKKEVIDMVNKDQSVRYANKFDVKLDKTNSNKIKKIIELIGWPKKSQFGEKVASGMWLIVQHADHDTEFQQKCLKLIKQAVKKNEADKKLIPFLEDRLLVNKNKKQIYGTQFYKNKTTGKLIPKSIRNQKHVDKLRKSVGLDPLSSYSKKLNESVKRIEK